MKLLKSKYFWLTLLLIALSVGSALILQWVVGFPGLYCWSGAGSFLIVGILILLLLRQRELLRRLAQNSGSAQPSRAEWDESWRKSLDAQLDSIFTSLQNSKSKALRNHRVFLVVSENETEFLSRFGSDPSVLETLPLQSAVGAADTYFHWVVTTESLFILLPQRLMQSEETPEIRYLIGRLKEKSGIKCLAGILLHSGGALTKAIALSCQRTFRAILAECQLELPLYAFLDYCGESEKQALLLSKGDILGQAFPFSRDVLPSVILKGALPSIIERGRNALVGQLTSMGGGQPEMQAGMRFLTSVESRISAFGSFLDLVAKPTLDREGLFLRCLCVMDSRSDCGVPSLAGVVVDSSWGQAQFEDESASEDSSSKNETSVSEVSAYLGFAKVFAFFKSESLLAVLPRYRQSQLSTKALIITVLVLGFGILLSAASIYSYSAGKLLEVQWESQFQQIQANLRWDTWEARKESLPWLDSLQVLNSNIQDDRPLALAPGFYRSSKVLSKSDSLYKYCLLGLQQDAIRIRTAVLQEMIAAPNPDKAALFGQLKNYMLFTAEGQTHLADEDPGVLADSLASIWESALQNYVSIDNRTHNSLILHAKFFAEWIQSHPIANDPTDHNIVQSARAIIQDAGNIEAVYQQIILEASVAYESQTPELLGLDAESGFQSAVSVNGAYTRLAFDSLVQNRIDKLQAVKGDWVAGSVNDDQSGVSASELRSNLWARYFQDYQAQWDSLFTSLTFKAPSESHDLSVCLKNLANAGTLEGKGIRSFMMRAAHNLDYTDLGKNPADNPMLKKKAKGGVQGALLKVASNALIQNPAQDLVDHFDYLYKINASIAEAGQDDYFTDMNALKDMLNNTSNDASSLKVTPFLAGAFSGDNGNALNRMYLEADRLFRELGPEQKVLTNALYVAPLEAVVARLLEYAQNGIERDYSERIIKPYQAIAASFPFNANSNKDVETDLLGRFLNDKQGSLTEFIRGLEPFLEIGNSAARYPKIWHDHKLAFDSKALDGLNRLQRLSSALFDGTNSISRTQIKANMVSNPRASLVLKTAGKEWKVAPGEPDLMCSFSWPSSDVDEFSLVVKTTTGEQTLHEQGPWALIRILWKQGRADSRNRCNLDWRVKDKSYYIPVSVVFSFESSDNPFVDPNFFRVDLGRSLFVR